MYSVTRIQHYNPAVEKIELPDDWMLQLSQIIEARQNDASTVNQLLQLLVSMTGINNISIAVPGDTNHFQAQYSSLNVENGMYSFVVQHSLVRAFDSSSVFILREESDSVTAFNRNNLVPLDFSHNDHCLLVPLRLRDTTLAVMVLDLREVIAGSLPLQELWFVCSQIANTMATQVVPNFQTMYSRPYQRVGEGDLNEIQAAIDKCSGNKTMAAKVLGLTTRQLRYRLAKLA